MWGLVAICGWCWVAFMLFVGLRLLDRDSQALRYGQLNLPFILVHQPVNLAIAFYVVKWELSIPIKLLVVSLGAFAVSIGVCELVIKRVGFLPVLFAPKVGPSTSVVEPQEAAPASRPGSVTSALPAPCLVVARLAWGLKRGGVLCRAWW